MATRDPAPDFLAILRAERRDIVDRLRQTRFSTLKPGYTQGQVIPHASYSPWLDDAAFGELYEKVRASTLVDVYRCYELWRLAQQMRPLAGGFVEVGVWRGGSAALLASAAPEKPIDLFDTFSGVAKARADVDTLYSGGEHADTDRATVEGLFASLSLACRIHVGVFPDDTLALLPDAVALAHIDVDTYASARDSFLAIWPVLTRNGVVVFDDYGFFGCEGVAQAVNELVASTRDAFLVHNLNGHALVIKRG